MDPAVMIRDETGADIGAITEVTRAAFSTLEVSNQTEHFIVAALRAAGARTTSLVAELDGRVVGHLAFSPVTMSDATPLTAVAGAGRLAGRPRSDFQEE